MRRDELNDLAAFAVVAEEGSFTRAASRLGMSQPALSHAMRGLEERLKVLERDHRLLRVRHEEHQVVDYSPP
jgi:DNA-binding transcriptional LysR family regulator